MGKGRSLTEEWGVGGRLTAWALFVEVSRAEPGTFETFAPGIGVGVDTVARCGRGGALPAPGHGASSGRVQHSSLTLIVTTSVCVTVPSLVEPAGGFRSPAVIVDDQVPSTAPTA